MYKVELEIKVPDVATALAISRNGKLLAVGCKDGRLVILDLASGQLVKTLGVGTSAHRDEIYALAWSPNSRYIASGGLDTTARTWDVRSGDVLCTYQGHCMAVVDLTWSPGGVRVASAGDATVQVWDSFTGDRYAHYCSHTSYVTSLAWSHNGMTIASGETLGNIHLWLPHTDPLILQQDYRAQTRVPYKPEHDTADFFAIAAIAFSPDDRFVASAQSFAGDENGTLHIWESATGHTVLAYPESHSGPAWTHRGLLWQDDGRRLLAIDSEGNLYTFFADPGSEVWHWQYQQLGEEAGYAACLVDSRTVLTTSMRDPLVRRWQVAI